MVSFDFNARGALEVGDEALLKGNRVVNNATSSGDGIVAGNYSVISENVVSTNGDIGVRCGLSCVISKNTSSQNDGHGIDTLGGSTVFGNSAYSNGGMGIQVGNGVISGACP